MGNRQKQVILVGKLPNNQYIDVPLTNEGHIETAIHGPINPFDSVNTESLRPFLQIDAIYGILQNQVRTRVNSSGSVTAADSLFTISTGTSSGGYGVLQSRKRIHYRPGQGVVARFTARFTTGVANSIQIAGLGHSEDGAFFGYNGTSFGILYSNRGVRETRTLTITTASSTNENVTVTLNGVAFTVAVTNSNNINRTAYEISIGSFGGWRAQLIGVTIVFLNGNAGPLSGTYSVAGTTIVGTFAQTKAGVASTDSWIAQSSWNCDPLNGQGGSGITLDPTKINNFIIGINHVSIEFKVKVSKGANNEEFIVVHRLAFNNTLTTTTFGNPNFPCTFASYSQGSTTDLIVRCGSMAAFTEGTRFFYGPRQSYLNALTTVGDTNIQSIFTVSNLLYFNGRSNQSVLNILSISAAVKHTSPVIIYLIRNGTLGGNPNFALHASGESSTLVDKTATTVAFSSNDQLIWAGMLGETGGLTFSFADDITIQPGEWVTLGARAVTGSPSHVVGSINIREDL